MRNELGKSKDLGKTKLKFSYIVFGKTQVNPNTHTPPHPPITFTNVPPPSHSFLRHHRVLARGVGPLSTPPPSSSSTPVFRRHLHTDLFSVLIPPRPRFSFTQNSLTYTLPPYYPFYLRHKTLELYVTVGLKLSFRSNGNQ